MGLDSPGLGMLRWFFDIVKFMKTSKPRFEHRPILFFIAYATYCIKIRKQMRELFFRVLAIPQILLGSYDAFYTEFYTTFETAF